MKYVKHISLAVMLLGLSACLKEPKLAQVYWQRVDGESGLYMVGPKAQQILDENIATCVSQIEELVRLDALRGTTPPDTHNEYHKALNQSGDLEYFDTPKRMGAMRVAHSDFYDFESCMRNDGWERVRYVQYDVDLDARTTYKKTQYYRQTGRMAEPDIIDQEEKAKKLNYFVYNGDER